MQQLYPLLPILAPEGWRKEAFAFAMEICDVMSSNASMGSKESEANYKHVHVRSAT